MKRSIISVIASLVGLVFLTIPAGAQSNQNCQITNTGPNSVNTCTNSETTTISVTCTNGFAVTNINSQTVSSGSVSVSGNTVSGNATSGEAGNVNQVTNELAAFCASQATTTTPAGGSGAQVAVAPTAPVAAQPSSTPISQIKALPSTGSTPAVTVVLGGLAAITTLLTGAYLVLRHKFLA